MKEHLASIATEGQRYCSLVLIVFHGGEETKTSLGVQIVRTGSIFSHDSEHRFLVSLFPLAGLQLSPYLAGGSVIVLHTASYIGIRNLLPEISVSG
jgi:hypothetical protein